MSGVTTSSLSLASSLRNWVILDYEEANSLTVRPRAPFLLSCGGSSGVCCVTLRTVTLDRFPDFFVTFRILSFYSGFNTNKKDERLIWNVFWKRAVIIWIEKEEILIPNETHIFHEPSRHNPTSTNQSSCTSFYAFTFLFWFVIEIAQESKRSKLRSSGGLLEKMCDLIDEWKGD